MVSRHHLPPCRQQKVRLAESERDVALCFSRVRRHNHYGHFGQRARKAQESRNQDERRTRHRGGQGKERLQIVQHPLQRRVQPHRRAEQGEPRYPTRQRHLLRHIADDAQDCSRIARNFYRQQRNYRSLIISL